MPRPKKNKSLASAPIETPSRQIIAEHRAAKNLLEDSDSEDDFKSAVGTPGGEFKVNESYARRFEHNKKREELHRCPYPPATPHTLSS